ncbi:MAG: hypothetical protein WC554_09410 [Clostridia bacterium]
MLIYVDIDGTICDSTEGYIKAKPLVDNIQKINKLYDENNTIIYWTGRGRSTGIDWTKLTQKQLLEWGCKYHELIMNQKPGYDLLIDDKTKRIEEI